MNDEKKLETLFDLTNHAGWKLLTSDMQDRIEATKDGISRAEVTAYQQGLANGHIKVYREMIGLRHYIELAREQSSEDDEVE